MAERNPSNSKNILVAEEIVKKFPGAVALKGVSAEIPRGELTLINGPSGSGKTTLLNLLSGLGRPDGGAIHYNNGRRQQDVASMSDRKLEKYRANSGLVFQAGGILSGLSAYDNIRAQHDLNGTKVDKAWTLELLDRLNIGQLITERPADRSQSGAGVLSGGQRQRLAVVRALAHRPDILFADEPTAALDTDSTREVHQVLSDVVQESGTTVVMVSHDETSLDYANNVIHITDGRISG